MEIEFISRSTCMVHREKVACAQAVDSCALEIVLLTYLLTYLLYWGVNRPRRVVCTAFCMLYTVHFTSYNTAFVHSAALQRST